MNGLRVFLKIAGVVSLHLGLWVVLFFFVFMRLLATPDFLLNSAQESGMYEAAAQEFITASLEEQSIEVSGVNIRDGQVREALGNVATPEFLQKQVETIVFSVYAWLEGETERPSFVLNLEEERESLAESLSQSVREELEALPTCASTEELQANANATDAVCTPEGFDPEQTQEEVKQELLQSDEFFESGQLNSEDIFEQNEQLKSSRLPTEFQDARSSWWYGGALLIVGVGLVLYASENRKQGIRLISIQLIIVGASLGLLGLLGLILESLSTNTADLTSLQLASLQILRDVGGEINKIVLLFGGASAAIGIAGIITSKQPPASPEDSTNSKNPKPTIAV